MESRKKYSKEFKAEAVKLVFEQGLTPAQASQDLGMSSSTLDNWLREARANRPEAEVLTESEKSELKRLRREVNTLRMERDILKKATAYFSRSSLPDASGS